MKRIALTTMLSLLGGCSATQAADSNGTAATAAGDSTTTGTATSSSTSTSVTTDAATACNLLGTQQSRVACAANAVLATLSSTQLATANLKISDYTNRSKWSNLPVQMKPRAGVRLDALSSESKAAVSDLMTIALSSEGHSVMNGILRADDYLGTMQGGYGSSLYSLAIFGTPSETGDFEVMFGGHHMAYNLNFIGGEFYPVPQHLGSEPKEAFTFEGETYSPLADLGDSTFAVYNALDATQRTTAYLSGQTFSDVVVNPDLDYGKGAGRTSKAAYPTGANRRGILVSNLTADQQALVTSLIEKWVRQYPAEVADKLMADYVAAYDDTYYAWGGASTGPNKEKTGSYIRIDGPRLWIELTVQGGIVIRGKTHYHTIFHDKTFDYGGQF